ncbi:mannose-6-phosphate isomerase [Pilibacter termitis]|uniref:Mannose-6-phosphate isomerase n=1 Tax=Pilibacter termitis TaxID=263852 RepID=A0A1T4NKM6_9ENTE|nr:mannose-6-phosphate isomerase, class I [Pilibacter termitis]SJZ79567.1 mannose-6-phosphate isomerase [Pilibacter termitis]
MKEPLFLSSVMQEKIWGGTRLHEVFGYDLPSEKIGEYWAISAHPHGVSTVKNGTYKGWKLDELWGKHRELFGNAKGDVFPLLTKILDAEDWLSVQVHPDDAYGLEHEGELGKTECWYVIDAEEGAEIIYGHHAKSREELRQMIEQGEWENLLTKVPVKKGDFFYVPSGTMHAIGKGIMILETQQSSDTTYRVYDFDRPDDNGNLRELHIEQSIDVMTIPAATPDLAIQQEKIGQSLITTFVENEFFNVSKWDINEELTLDLTADYTLASVLEGEGSIQIEENTWNIGKGDHFILPNEVKKITLTGKLSLIVSSAGE